MARATPRLQGAFEGSRTLIASTVMKESYYVSLRTTRRKSRKPHRGPIEFLLSHSRISSRGLPSLMHAHRAKYLSTFHLFPPGRARVCGSVLFLSGHSQPSRRAKKHSVSLLFSFPPILFSLRAPFPLPPYPRPSYQPRLGKL